MATNVTCAPPPPGPIVWYAPLPDGDWIVCVWIGGRVIARVLRSIVPSYIG